MSPVIWVRRPNYPAEVITSFNVGLSTTLLDIDSDKPGPEYSHRRIPTRVRI